MLVTLRGFGGVWERRLSKNPAAPNEPGRTAFYNTTGVVVGGKMRYRWRIGGKIRLNGSGGFNASYTSRSLNRVFECKEPETTRGVWTQVWFQKMLAGPERPDFFLFVVTAANIGRLDIGSPWKSDSVQVVALSEHADEQEAMLLMPAYSWVRGELGTFYVEPSTKQFWSADLRLGRA